MRWRSLWLIRRCIALAVAAAICAAGSPAQAPTRLYHTTHNAMGTVFTLDLYAADAENADRLTQEAFETVDRIEDELSNYRPASELSRISREAAAGPVTTDPETFAFLQRSLYWSQRSAGAFDITVGPLLRAWGFFFHGGRVPSPQELAALRDRVGWQKVRLNATARSVRFVSGVPLELDPGSIGKGFAVDRVVQQLRSEGVGAAFFSAGGSTMYGIGAPPGETGWPVIVPDPRTGGGRGSTVLLRDVSLSTGACTQKFFIKNSHRYCHIFNPHTLRPVEGMLQTTVIDPSATDSDALSTVAFVFTPSQSRRFFATMPKTKVLLFTKQTSGRTCLALHWQGDACFPETTTPEGQHP